MRQNKELKQLAYDPFTQFTGGCVPSKKEEKSQALITLVGFPGKLTSGISQG